MYKEKLSYLYIIASGKNGTLYIGITANLQNRINEHKQGLVEGFTKKYNIKNLVYYEIFGDIKEAITKEKQLKKWKREWKIKLIEKYNPGWEDLYNKLF
ncbi:MAG: GIY-YIG nuclease family protein [Patescibacteria group bacterium]|jgi:putative endonuclease